MPQLEAEIWQRFKDQGVQVFCILLKNAQGNQPSLGDLQTWADMGGVTFPVLQAADLVGITYGIPAYPTNFIIDQQMIIAWKIVGLPQNWQPVIDFIEDLLGEETPTPVPSYTPTPTPPHTPPPTETPTITPTSSADEFNFTLQLTDDFLEPGDYFDLTAEYYNPLELFQADVYVVLDVLGAYFWHPQWTQEISHELTTFVMGTGTLDILQFTWPDVQDRLNGLFFYGAVTEQGTFEFLDDVSVIQFGYGY